MAASSKDFDFIIRELKTGSLKQQKQSSDSSIPCGGKILDQCTESTYLTSVFVVWNLQILTCNNCQGTQQEPYNCPSVCLY